MLSSELVQAIIVRAASTTVTLPSLRDRYHGFIALSMAGESLRVAIRQGDWCKYSGHHHDANSGNEDTATIFEQLRLGKTWEGTFILKHRDGTPILAHVTDIPVRVGEDVVGIIGVSRKS